MGPAEAVVRFANDEWMAMLQVVPWHLPDVDWAAAIGQSVDRLAVIVNAEVGDIETSAYSIGSQSGYLHSVDTELEGIRYHAEMVEAVVQATFVRILVVGPDSHEADVRQFIDGFASTLSLDPRGQPRVLYENEVLGHRVAITEDDSWVCVSMESAVSTETMAANAKVNCDAKAGSLLPGWADVLLATELETGHWAVAMYDSEGRLTKLQATTDDDTVQATSASTAVLFVEAPGELQQVNVWSQGRSGHGQDGSWMEIYPPF